MKDIFGKSKIKQKNLPGKLTIEKVDFYNKPEIADVSMIYLQVLVRNWLVKYQNYL